MTKKDDKVKKNIILRPFLSIKKKIVDFLSRRPHRSFQLTKRRDYIKNFNLPGYFSFTGHVLKTIWRYKAKFFGLALLYSLLTGVLVGMASQSSIVSLKDTLESLGSGNVGIFGESGLLFLTALSGGLNSELSDAQQVYSGLVLIMAWLSYVWLIRNLLAGHKVKIRDAVYGSGSPIISTFLLFLLLIVQALPIALALIGYGAAAGTGLLDSGVEAMLFWIAAVMLGVLSLYWMTGTLISLIVVTLPGMYPGRALKIGGDLVVGRRLKILGRFLWMIVVALAFWAIILIPAFMIGDWLGGIWTWYNSVPVIPILILVMSSLSTMWVATYVYLLYRKVVADDAR